MKYVPGLMVGQLSGKAGSTVASRNKGGSYFRTRVIPKHVVNPATTQVRLNFGSNAQLYRELQQGQRDAWSALGAQLTRKTSLGETIHLTGIQALMAVNRNLFSIGLDPLSDAPPVVTPPDLGTAAATAAAGAPLTTTVVAGANSATQNVTTTVGMYEGAILSFPASADYRTVISVTDGTHVVLDAPVNTTTADSLSWTGLPDISFAFDLSPIPAGFAILVEATSPLSAGVGRPSRGQFRQISTGTGTTSPMDLSADYFRVFGLATAGSKVFLRARIVAFEGFTGPQIAAVAIVS